MRFYDKIFVIWDKDHGCIARLPRTGYSPRKACGIYLCKSHITNSPKAQELLKDKKRYVIREVQLDNEM